MTSPDPTQPTTKGAPVPTLTETLQDLAANAATTRERAIVRARLVMATINDLRGSLIEGHTYDTDQAAALLASYDAELTRLCQIPGVLAALLAETVVDGVTP